MFCLPFSKAAYPENITPALLKAKLSHFHILYEYAAAAQKIKGIACKDHPFNIPALVGIHAKVVAY